MRYESSGLSIRGWQFLMMKARGVTNSMSPKNWRKKDEGRTGILAAALQSTLPSSSAGSRPTLNVMSTNGNAICFLLKKASMPCLSCKDDVCPLMEEWMATTLRPFCLYAR